MYILIQHLQVQPLVTPGTRGLKSKYGNMFDNIKTGFGEGNITGGITGIVTGIAGAMVNKCQIMLIKFLMITIRTKDF